MKNFEDALHLPHGVQHFDPSFFASASFLQRACTCPKARSVASTDTERRVFAREICTLHVRFAAVRCSFRFDRIGVVVQHNARTRDRRKYVRSEMMPAFVTFASHLGRYISTRGLRLCWWARSSVLHFYIKSILSIPRMAPVFDR